MRVSTLGNGNIQLTLTVDEAQEIVQDGMFDDADTLAVTSRMRDVLVNELDDDIEDEDEDEDDDLDDDDDIEDDAADNDLDEDE